MMKFKSPPLAKVASAAFFFACAPAMAQWQVPNNAVAIGRGSPNQGFKNVPLPSGSLLIGQSGIPLAIIPTGDVTISTAGVTTIGAGKVTNSMLAGSIAASKLIGTDIATVGTITAGAWNGTAIAVANGGTGATSAATARTNLGLAIGSNVQAWDADLDAFALKTAPTGAVVGTSDTQTLTGKTINCVNNTCTVRLPNDVTGILPAANHPALTGDVTSVAGALATTLATVNANVGSFGSASAVPNFTVNAKGLTVAAGSAAYQDGTNAAKGVVRGDGTTITCAAGVCTAVGAAAASIDAGGATSVSNGTGDGPLTNNASKVGNVLWGQLPGIASNSAASAGRVGETRDSVVANTTISTIAGASFNCTSISLTAGDWEVNGVINYLGAAATSTTELIASLTTTSLSVNTAPGMLASANPLGQTLTNTAFVTLPIPNSQFIVNTTTTVYLTGRAQFTGGNISAGCSLHARRVR